MDKDFIRSIEKKDLTKVTKTVVLNKVAEERKKEEKREGK